MSASLRVAIDGLHNPSATRRRRGATSPEGCFLDSFDYAALVGALLQQRDASLFGSAQEVARRYRERYVPGQRLYLADVEPERWASVVVDNDDPRAPAIHPVADRIP